MPDARRRNELAPVLALIEEFRSKPTTRRRFARRHRLHPSALSRLLRVAELPRELLDDLSKMPRLSRTHLEVVATAPPERRPALLEGLRRGQSTYVLRARRESTAVPLGTMPAAPVEAPPAPGLLGESDAARLAEIGAALEATPQETLAFALELVSVLLRSSPDRVAESFETFRHARARR